MSTARVDLLFWIGAFNGLLPQLFQHQVHHRGQAQVQLHALEGKPPQLDDFHLQFERVFFRKPIGNERVEPS